MAKRPNSVHARLVFVVLAAYSNAEQLFSWFPATVVETLLDTLLGGFVLPETKTTILQDWMKGRRSEVDDINGRVVSESRAHGLAAPVNAAVVELAHRIEQGQLIPSPDNFAQLAELADR